MAPEIDEFDFGQNKSFRLPAKEPPPSPALVYTAWHLWRALRCHRRDVIAGKRDFTVTPIFGVFKELKVVRMIQPFRRTKNGTVEYVRTPPPLKPREQAAILLYALLPTEEGEKCSCCTAYDGRGPFRLCIDGGERRTGGACLNCYYIGTASKCDLRKKHEAQRQLEMEDNEQLPRRYDPSAAETASFAELESWLAQIEREELRRLADRSR